MKLISILRRAINLRRPNNGSTISLQQGKLNAAIMKSLTLPSLHYKPRKRPTSVKLISLA